MFLDNGNKMFPLSPLKKGEQFFFSIGVFLVPGFPPDGDRNQDANKSRARGSIL